MNAVEALSKVLTRSSSLAELYTRVSHAASAPAPFGRPVMLHIKMSYNPNPYHNIDHAIHVASCCRMLMNLYEVTVDDGANELWFAAFMHDARHSGGSAPDSINVQRAISAADVVASHTHRVRLRRPMVSRLIQVTEFDAKSRTFVHEPITMCEKIIRDADLLGFTSPNWPKMLAGLFREMYGDQPSSDDATMVSNAERMLRLNTEFLSSCTFYTDFARKAFTEYSEEVFRALEHVE